MPEAVDVQLGNDAVTLTGTVLYADLAESTNLVKSFKPAFAAEIYKCYLRSACRIVQNNGGVVTAFDGDRVMGVFIGDVKNTPAVASALQIKYAVAKIVNPMIKQVYPESTFEVQQSVGIDTSPLFIARTGVRGSNDLVWVGRAANYAAKLCSLREDPYSSWITADVYNSMHNSVKFSSGDSGEQMWEERTWTPYGISIYRSKWMRSI